MNELPFNDSVIESIAQSNDLPTIQKTENLFIDLVEAIVSQQLSGKVAKTIFTRFCALFPNQKPTPQRVDQTSVDNIKAVGLSNAKANYVKNIATYAQSNSLAVEYFDLLADKQIVDELTQIKGVGEWTAQMILIFSLNRPDVFPLGDLAIRQGMKTLYGIESEGKELNKEIVEISSKWKPYRTIGSRYVWLHVNLQKSNATRY